MRFKENSKEISRRVRWFVVGSMWLGGVVVGLTLLAHYDTTAGVSGSAPRSWPQDSRIHLSGQHNTLIMFAHPRCPCTRASLGELAKILARCPHTVSPHVVFFKPSDTAETWDHTDQWTAAVQMPGVNVIRDIDGIEARLFQAATSGHTLLYSPAGKLLFSGGITFARAHEGDNPGRVAIETLLTGSIAETGATPVFGCPILGPSDQS